MGQQQRWRDFPDEEGAFAVPMSSDSPNSLTDEDCLDCLSPDERLVHISCFVLCSDSPNSLSTIVL